MFKASGFSLKFNEKIIARKCAEKCERAEESKNYKEFW